MRPIPLDKSLIQASPALLEYLQTPRRFVGTMMVVRREDGNWDLLLYQDSPDAQNN